MNTPVHEATLSGVLWDMDGTLIDSEPLWLAAEKVMLDRYGITLDAVSWDRLVGSGLWDAAEYFREMGVPMSADDIVNEWVSGVSAGLEQQVPAWRPGAVDLLASLAEAGIPCAIVTMSVRSLAEQVAAMLPAGFFAGIIGGDDVVHPKPHPEAYLRGAELLGVPAEHCIAFEDSNTGLRAAWQSGAVAVGVPNLLDLSGTRSHALWPTLEGLTAHELRERFLELRSTD